MRRISFCSLLLALVVCTAIVPAQVKISQVYGAGGNTGSPWLNDYIEIYNAGAPQDITGWSVQYASATGAFSAANTTALPAVILGTGQYLLVQESNGGTLLLDQAMALPAAQATALIAMAATDFKVALVSSTTFLPIGTPTYTGNPTLVDFVGVGTTANWNDFSAAGGAQAVANNAPPANTQIAVYRVGCGATDTNNSRTDWAVGYPSPRNTSTALNNGISAIGAALPHLLEENQTVRLTCTPFRCATNDLGLATVVSIDLSLIGGAVNVPMTDDGLGADEAANDGVYTTAAVVLAGTTVGTKSMPVLVSDGGGNTGGCYIGLVVYVTTTPDNDNCTSAQAIVGPYAGGVNTSVTFTGAHVESQWIATVPLPFPPQTFAISGGNSSRRGLWYTVVGTGNTMRADTCQTSTDTEIIVWGGSCDGMIHIVNSDDSGSGGPCGATNTLASYCEWCSLSGTTYYVYCGPFSTGAQTTTTTLRITDLGTSCSTALPVATCAPTFPVGATVEAEAGYGVGNNDGCDSTPNRFTDIPGVVGFPGLPIRGNARNMDGNKDVDWFRFQAAVSDTITVTITPQLPCQVAIMSLGAGGACPATAIGVSAPSNRCLPVSASASAVAGNWYAVRILQSQAPVTYFGGIMPGGLSYHYTGVVSLGGPPPNDNCANATNLALPASVGGATNAMTTNDGTASCDPSGPLGLDVWYKFTLSGTSNIHLDTCGSAADTTLAVYTGVCGSLVEVPGGCNDDANGCGCAAPNSNLDLLGLTAGTYTVRVSTKAVGGSFVLHVSTLVNDNCCSALPVACGSATSGTTVFATAEVGLPVGCIGPQAPGVGQSFTYTNSVWYTVTAPPTGGTMYADTLASTYDSKIFVWTGTCGALQCVTGNDDIKGSPFQSKAAWKANPNQQYFLMVGPFSTTTGNFILTVGCAPTPANDDCSTPTVLSPAPGGSIAGTTVGATCSEVYTSTTAFPSCAGVGGIFDVWYSYTACANANVTFNTCGAYDTTMSIHTACPGIAGPNNQIASACNDNGPVGCTPGSSLTIPVTSGTTYLIRVVGVLGANPEGNFTLTWAADGPVFYQDNDGDGFGNPASSIVACVQPGGYVTNNQDCDDSNAAIKPGAVEVCDGIDNDCDTLIDDMDPGIVGQTTWYQDFDGDSYGNPAVTQLKCFQPTGYVSNNADCDDSNGAINPAAVEICDGLDNDCDLAIDDADPSITGQTTWYQDFDGDSYGNPAVTQLSCSQPSGYVANNTDCNDTNAAVNPAAVEICNGIDDDCDSIIDEVCPPNDHCASALAIVDGSYNGDNSLAASEIGDLTCGAVTNDVWYSYTNTKTCTWNVTASLCAIDGGGAAYDAVLHVFNACGGGLIACNDNFCGTSPKVTFSLAGGATALIAVSAVAPGPGGNFTIVVFHGSAAFSQLGPGCSDGGGPGPTLTIDAAPVICSNRVLSISGAAPAASGMLMFSFPGTPTGLTGGCPLYLNQGSLTLLFFIGTDPFGNWSAFITAPCDPALECATFTVQGILFPTSPPPFYQVTSGLSVTLGL